MNEQNKALRSELAAQSARVRQLTDDSRALKHAASSAQAAADERQTRVDTLEQRVQQVRNSNAKSNCSAERWLPFGSEANWSFYSKHVAFVELLFFMGLMFRFFVVM